MYKAQVKVVGSTLQSDVGDITFNGVAPTEGWTWTGLEIQLPETAILKDFSSISTYQPFNSTMNLANATFELSEQHPLLRWRVNEATLWSQHIFTKDEEVGATSSQFDFQNKTLAAGKLKVSFTRLDKPKTQEKSNAPRRYRILMPYLAAALLCYCF